MKKSLILASLFAVSASAFAASLLVSNEDTDKAAPASETITINETASTDEVISTETIKPSFQSMDANQDGLISIDEAESNEMLLEAFVELDLDKTADLTEAEYSKFAALAE
jgi:Ca2+-binding EF-hand superfamily protein